MKSFSCSHIDRSLWRYIDRELAASDVSAISAHLRDCDGCRELYHERAREARQYRVAFLDSPFGERFVSKFSERMKREGLSAGSIRKGGQWRKDPRKERLWTEDVARMAQGLSPTDSNASSELPVDSGFTRRRFRRAATVAAMLFLIPTVVVIGIVFNPPHAIPLGTFEAEKGSLTESRIGIDGELISKTVEDGFLTPGCVLTVPPGVVARLALRARAPGDVTEISLSGPAELRLSKDAGPKAFTAVLEYGILEASVAPRREGETFEIFTANALAAVVGTRFELEFRDGLTSLVVWHGEVRFQAREALTGVRVVRESGRFRLNPGSVRPEPDASPPAVPAAEPPPEAETSAAEPADSVHPPSRKPHVPSSAPDLDTPFVPAEAER
jgi:hypothetical protein